MDEVVTRLRLDANALGVWLLGPLRGATSIPAQDRCEVMASSVRDDSFEPPRSVSVEGEAFIDLGTRKLYALSTPGGTLVVMFDEHSSLGLVRLRARKAATELQPLLARRS